MMKKLCKETIKKIFDIGLEKGDFVELFLEDKKTFRLEYQSKKVESVESNDVFGIGIRILSGNNCVYGHTNDLKKETLLNLTKELSDSLELSEERVEGIYNEKVETNNLHYPKILPSTILAKEKLELLKKADKAARDYDKRITQVIGSYMDSIQEVQIINSKGVNKKDLRVLTRLMINCVAKDKEVTQTGSFFPGGQKGFEFYTEDYTPEEVGVLAATQGINLLAAVPAPSGEFPVIVENGFGGVIFHEASGHGLESSSVSKGLSVFSNKIGEQIANPCITAIDDGTIPNGWGSIAIDDEGNEGEKKILIKDGILQSYMTDILGARRMKTNSTGSGRRESYKYPPTSRMTNTYLANGTSTLEEMLNGVKFGIYAKAMGGGSVDPITGDFNFAVIEGYLIEDGKITKPIKGASLIGNGPKVLQKIDMVGDNLKRAQGMCGASSGSIPTDVGQPRVRISSITVGGGN